MLYTDPGLFGPTRVTYSDPTIGILSPILAKPGRVGARSGAGRRARKSRPPGGSDTHKTSGAMAGRGSAPERSKVALRSAANRDAALSASTPVQRLDAARAAKRSALGDKVVAASKGRRAGAGAAKAAKPSAAAKALAKARKARKASGLARKPR